MESMDGPLRRDFPLGVLAVDSDIVHLLNLIKVLRFFNYQVTTCQTATGALSLLRKRTNEFHILMSDVALPDSDGFDLLTVSMSEFPALQVVLFSSTEYETTAVRALELGACAFYTKPIPPAVLEHVWQYVFIRKIESLFLPPPLLIESPVCRAPLKSKRDDHPKSSLGKGVNGFKKTTVGKGAGSKKPRLWSPELRAKFGAAVDFIGADNLTAGKILKVMEKMGVVGLSESKVSSHLQQYRKTNHLLSKKKKSSSVERTSKTTPSFSPAQEEDTTAPSTAVESYLLTDDQITSPDYTSSQQSSQPTSGGADDDFDLCMDLSFLDAEVITDLLACT